MEIPCCNLLFNSYILFPFFIPSSFYVIGKIVYCIISFEIKVQGCCFHTKIFWFVHLVVVLLFPLLLHCQSNLATQVFLFDYVLLLLIPLVKYS